MASTQPSPSPQLSSSPSPNNPIVIVIVMVSVGGLALLSLLAFALFCFFQKTKKKTTQETDVIHIDKHKKGKETIVPCPFGKQAVVIEVEDDVHVDETKKSEKLGHGLHAKSSSSSSVARIDEHKKGKETIVPGPFGQQAVEISVEDDVHVDEVKKSEQQHHHQLENKP